MKVFWGIVFTLFAGLGGLFMFQNQTRTLSVDTAGNQVSFDLGFWGLASTDLSFAALVCSVFGIGTVFGLLIPYVYRDIFASK